MGKAIQEISIPIGHVDNVLDLANLLKKFFNADIEILNEKSGNEGVAIIARLNYKRYFLDRLYYNVSSEFIKITVYVVGNSKIELDEDIVDLLTKKKLKKERDVYVFETIKALVNFLKFQLTQIDFPQINVEDLKQIDLSEREKRLDQWQEAFEKLIPWGVNVSNQRNEEIASCNWIFELEPPRTPLPMDLAIKNQRPSRYYEEAGEIYERFNKSGVDGCEQFFPGESDWNKQYQSVVNHLKKIYKVDVLKER